MHSIRNVAGGSRVDGRTVDEKAFDLCSRESWGFEDAVKDVFHVGRLGKDGNDRFLIGVSVSGGKAKETAMVKVERLTVDQRIGFDVEKCEIRERESSKADSQLRSSIEHAHHMILVDLKNRGPHDLQISPPLVSAFP